MAANNRLLYFADAFTTSKRTVHSSEMPSFLLDVNFLPMLWPFFLTASCLIEVLQKPKYYKSISFVMSDMNTVHYIQTKVVSLDEKTRMDSENNFKTSIVIYRDRMYDPNSVVYRDDKMSLENSFFFTASTKGKYYMLILVENPKHTQLGLEYKIFSGEANRPEIVSNNDVEVSKAEFRIRKLLDYVKTNIDVQRMDYDDDELYKKLYSGIIKKAIFVICFKIMATVFTLAYSSWKTRKFFSTQGMLDQKN